MDNTDNSQVALAFISHKMFQWEEMQEHFVTSIHLPRQTEKHINLFTCSTNMLHISPQTKTQQAHANVPLFPKIIWLWRIYAKVKASARSFSMHRMRKISKSYCQYLSFSTRNSMVTTIKITVLSNFFCSRVGQTLKHIKKILNQPKIIHERGFAIMYSAYPTTSTPQPTPTKKWVSEWTYSSIYSSAHVLTTNGCSHWVIHVLC